VHDLVVPASSASDFVLNGDGVPAIRFENPLENRQREQFLSMRCSAIAQAQITAITQSGDCLPKARLALKCQLVRPARAS
jgi:hypothetical protein